MSSSVLLDAPAPPSCHPDAQRTGEPDGRGFGPMRLGLLLMPLGAVASLSAALLAFLCLVFGPAFSAAGAVTLWTVFLSAGALFGSLLPIGAFLACLIPHRVRGARFGVAALVCHTVGAIVSVSGMASFLITGRSFSDAAAWHVLLSGVGLLLLWAGSMCWIAGLESTARHFGSRKLDKNFRLYYLLSLVLPAGLLLLFLTQAFVLCIVVALAALLLRLIWLTDLLRWLRRLIPA
jgi:hypothetical protein